MSDTQSIRKLIVWFIARYSAAADLDDVSWVTDETNLVSDCGLDDIDLVEVIFELEMSYGIEIDDDTYGPDPTVGDLISLVSAAIANTYPAIS